MMNKQEIKEKLKENGAWCTECHTGEEGRYVEIGKAMDLVGQLEEPQKPVLPKFVAELLDYYRQSPDVDLSALLITFKDWYYSTVNDGTHTRQAVCWLVEHPEIYMRAWLYGYKVEKEPLYYVILSENKDGWKYTFLDEAGSADFTNYKTDIPTFTEKEIKEIDERFWAFAVPVDEEEK